MSPTDPTPDDVDPDELAVHAVLDGEATADERRRVARDPRLRARLAELRPAAEALAEAPPSPEPDVLAQLRARALGALDQASEPGDDPSDQDPEAPRAGSAAVPAVSTLPPRRPRRRLPPLPAVAAVVLVLMVVGVALIATGGDDADQSAGEAATSAATGSDATLADGADDEGAATGGSAERASPDDAASADAPADEGRRDLGEPGATYPDEEALRTALEQLDDPLTLRSLQPSPDTAAAARTAAASRCGDVLQGADPAIGAVQGSALVVVEDADLLVVSTPRAATRDTQASTRLFALDPDSCVPLLGVDR